MNDLTPKSMGDYAILGVLGAGGMGRVYKVRNVITDRVEAMKVLLPDLQGHEDLAARFLREIKLLAALKHPNIAGLHTAQTINNQLVMIMEYVEGTTLADLLSRGAIPPQDALHYIDQVLDALSYAHQQRIIHRDIKPANMMLTADGVIKLMDFGIARTEGEPAKLTATGTTLGSINYMSPEQVQGQGVDERSDLYSVGISLYEMVTGTKPFHGDSNFSIMAAHINEAPRPPVELRPGLPEGLNEIILTAIAKSPTSRFQSADAFRMAVRAVMRSIQDSNTIIQGSANTVVTSTAGRNAAALAAAASPAIKTPTSMPVPPRPAMPPPVAASPQVPPPVPIQSGSHRGLYMILGALVVVVGLVAAGIYLPGRGGSRVAAEQGSQPAPAASQPAAPVAQSQPASSEPAAPASVEQKVESSKSEPVILAKSASSAPKQSFQQAQPSSAPAAAPKEDAAAAAAREAELDAIEREIDQLTGRAGAVNSSLDRLQREQAAAGYGLRGDIAAKHASMKVNLAKAQGAIERGDATRAKRYADLAAADMEALEKFLGR